MTPPSQPTGRSDDWLPIDTLPEGGTEIVEILMSGGDIAHAPGIGKELPHDVKVKLAKLGHWPDHKNFTPTHWRRIKP